MEVTCHCGNVTIKAAYLPKDVVVTYATEKSVFYIWGDKEVEFHRCSLCGCITHYVTTPKCDENIFAINLRLAENCVLAGIPVRRIDGASSPLD